MSIGLTHEDFSSSLPRFFSTSYKFYFAPENDVKYEQKIQFLRTEIGFF
jgi:hypothetical protein